MRQAEHQRRRARIRCLRGRDLPVFEQCIDHQIPPPDRFVRMVDRRIQRRPFGQPGEQRRFFESELFGRLAEVKLRCGLESVHPVAQRDLVRIQRKDL